MKLSGAELRFVSLPLVTPFRTSLGTQTVRNALVLRLETSQGEGWAECVADDEPGYSPEYLMGAADVIRRFFLPRLFAVEELDPAGVAVALDGFRGHPMAKAAVEMAVLDASLRATGTCLSAYLGGVRHRVPVGVSVGITDTIDELLGLVDKYLTAGYLRIKLKIQPGWDIEPVRAVRETFGPSVPLTVDANTAYRQSDTRHLRRLDEFGLLLVEQPFAPEDLYSHARLAAAMDTPICLDESITSARDAVSALRQGACSVINIKPGRVGGYLEARRVHDVAQAHGVPVWCGGMLETGLGRAANLALAALPGFQLPGDISATARYYTEDITAPFSVTDGHLDVPSDPGIGIVPNPASLDRLTTSAERIVR
ncbi:o-succinylbenzoate synthase [Streptosporangium roseum]|uniref:o-succinylbenzoate synthase n=1 Tax=Streptosporangium roseum TaxID=2001 RepID=UPI0004CD550B|nr:o-succinylbenzoate synthase [Streptosporangium roseum]